MAIADCRMVRYNIEQLLDGYLDVFTAAAVERHIASCPDCFAARASIEALRSELSRMPVPDIRPQFADYALAAAAGQALTPAEPPPAPARLSSPPTGSWRRFELWLGTAIGAAAAAALVLVLWSPTRTVEPVEDLPGVRLALHEARELSVLIEAERPMPAAMLTVTVDGGIDLVGFGEQREVRWQADLEAGANVLSLPIIAHSLEEGTLTARVEHGSRTRRIAVKVRVAPAPSG